MDVMKGENFLSSLAGARLNLGTLAQGSVMNAEQALCSLVTLGSGGRLETGHLGLLCSLQQ